MCIATGDRFLNRVARGTAVFKISRAFAVRSVCKTVSPVMLPPGRGRLATCPSSTGSAWVAKAFLVPGDEVLVNVTEQGPYVCATFKTQSGILTRGFLSNESAQQLHDGHASIPSQA